MIKRINDEDTYINYNEKEYSVQVFENNIIITRLSDNKVVKIFNNVININQCKKNGVNHFIVERVVNEDLMIEHYYDSYTNEGLLFEKKFNCFTDYLDNRKFGDNTFLIGSDKTLYFLYNLNSYSDRFDAAYYDKKINEILNKEVVMVVSKKRSYYNPKFEDTITYGIDPETFKIITPIWSELQQRFINVYTDESLLDIYYGYTLDELTIKNEICNPLYDLSLHFDTEKKIYDEDDKFNPDFIKKFIR